MHRTTRRLTTALATLALLVFAAPPAQAQDAEPFTGIWILDLEESMYEVAEAPDWRLLEIEDAGDGRIHYTSHSYYSDERSPIRETTITTDLEGTAVVEPVSGAEVSLMRMGERDIELHAMARNDAESTQHWEVSPDGDVLTITAEGRDTFGNSFTNELVYARGDEDDLRMYVN
jgi:hypothetical protein